MAENDNVVLVNLSYLQNDDNCKTFINEIQKKYNLPIISPIYKKNISSICDSCNVSYEAYKLYNTGLPAIIINYENILKINFNNTI